MSTYQKLDPISRDDATVMLESTDPHVVTEAILRLALHDPDGAWVTDRALELLRSPSTDIRSVTTTALGHIARIHHTIDTERVIPALQRLANDPDTAGRAEDALDDIAMFASENHHRELNPRFSGLLNATVGGRRGARSQDNIDSAGPSVTLHSPRE